MNLLQKSARAWKEIIEYRYLFVYGYKKQLYPINLIFSLNEYPHLAGFQYAKDIALPNYSSAKIADRVIEGKISFDTLKKATQYKDMIKPRLEALIHLKESLDNEFNLYSFMPRMYPFYTTIKADYLISSHTYINNFIFIINTNSQNESKCDFLCCSTFETTIKADYLISSHTYINNFIFIINTNSQNESKCDFLCCSTFEKGKRDYETNQRAKTLLKKERIHIPSNTSVIFFDKIN